MSVQKWEITVLHYILQFPFLKLTAQSHGRAMLVERMFHQHNCFADISFRLCASFPGLKSEEALEDDFCFL